MDVGCVGVGGGLGGEGVGHYSHGMWREEEQRCLGSSTMETLGCLIYWYSLEGM